MWRGPMIGRFAAAAALALGLAAVPADAQSNAESRPDTRPTPTFAGRWTTTFGALTLRLDGVRAHGAYDLGELEGAVEGRTLAFRYREAAAAGEGRFELAADGGSFAGAWRKDGDADFAPWNGARAAARAPFDGLFETTFGRMRLVADGDRVRGVYAFGGGATLEGRVANGTLVFRYREPDGATGEGSFAPTPDGAGFQGRWRRDGAPDGAYGTWTGTVVAPRPGRKWLVVFEAHWEGGLADQPYSYGDMLRTYFARVPTVDFRHRFVHDAADFARYAAELVYLAEPIVLYVSSHGTESGPTIGGAPLGAAPIVAALRAVPQIELLHFGACSVMSGAVPAEIRRALGPRTPAISGFLRPADWGGSAIVDFAYLDLLLARGASPADAVEAVRATIASARDVGEPGTETAAFPPMGLAVLKP